MQVSHVNKHVTHAVIGGGEDIPFTVSDSPEFFQILSKNIYSNQILAVVREILCNAWDAHIEAGLTDKPIQVTLTPTEFSVRDFGAGIHPDQVGPLYGRYGSSTKIVDGRVTGGFGLGCKAPFAYTDHFQMISCHAGQKTIYAISKSSAEHQGRPAINPIAFVPTTESGVTVTVPIKTINQESFRDDIIRITANGEMLVELNGQLLSTIPMSKAEHGWMFIFDQPHQSYSQVYVKLGNVIYPIFDHKDYRREFEFIRKIINYKRTVFLILQAPPHSLAVMPSREELSMQQLTLNTLKDLLKNFISCYQNNIVHYQLECVKERIACDPPHIGNIFSLGGVFVASEQAPYIYNYPALAQFILKNDYTRSNAFIDGAYKLCLEYAIEHKLAPVGHLKDLLKNQNNKFFSFKNWYEKILRKLFRDLQASLCMDHTKLFFMPGDGTKTFPLSLHCFPVIENKQECLSTLRQIVVLSHSSSRIEMKASIALAKTNLGSTRNTLFYVAPRSKKLLPSIREFFISRGYRLVDLTIKNDNVEPIKLSPEPTLPKKPKKPHKKGYPLLSACRQANKPIRIDNCFEFDAPHTTTPEFYERVFRSKALDRSFNFRGFTFHHSKLILDLFGSNGVAVDTSAKEEKLKAQNIPELLPYVINRVSEQVSTCSEFLTYWEYSLLRYENHDAGVTHIRDNLYYYKQLLLVPELAQALGLQNQLCLENQKYLELWETLIASIKIHIPDQKPFEKAIDIIKATPIAPEAAEIGVCLHNSKTLRFLDADSLLRFFKNASKQPSVASADVQAAVDLVVKALKG